MLLNCVTFRYTYVLLLPGDIGRPHQDALSSLLRRPPHRMNDRLQLTQRPRPARLDRERRTSHQRIRVHEPTNPLDCLRVLRCPLIPQRRIWIERPIHGRPRTAHLSSYISRSDPIATQIPNLLTIMHHNRPIFAAFPPFSNDRGAKKAGGRGRAGRGVGRRISLCRFFPSPAPSTSDGVVAAAPAHHHGVTPAPSRAVGALFPRAALHRRCECRKFVGSSCNSGASDTGTK